jgi:hypothetical protein
MKAHWQRGMLVSGLALIGWAMVALSVQASTPQDQGMRSETPARVSSPINSVPVSATAVYTLYFPIIIRPPGMLYGTVTEFGSPAADVTLQLQRCLTWFTNPGGNLVCATWDAYSATTDHNGWYAFIDPPTLVISPGEVFSQTYRAYWNNWPTVPNRLVSWNSRTIDSYTQGDFVNLGNFDIGDITPLTPTVNAAVHFPVTFRWVPRRNVPTDNYNVCVSGGLFIPKFDPGDFICLGPGGYTDQVTMSDPFTGIDYGYDYQWYVEVSDDTGGAGYSANVPFTFVPP